MMRLSSSNVLNNVKGVRASQSLQKRFQSTRRGLSTSNAGSGNGANKPPVVPPKQQSSSMAPLLIATLALTISGATTLATKQLYEKDPSVDLTFANAVADLPVLGYIVESQLEACKVFEKAGFLEPKQKPVKAQPFKVQEPVVVQEPEPEPVVVPEPVEEVAPEAEQQLIDFHEAVVVPEPVEETAEEKEQEVVAHAEEALVELHAEKEEQSHQVGEDAVHLDAHHQHTVTHQQEEVHVAAPVEAHTEVHEVQQEGHLPRVSSEQSLAVGKNNSVGDVLSTVAKNSLALRHELENALLKDIHSLDAPALRIRITQLAAEMFERLSWESIRLSHSVRQVENELTDKYESLMNKQRKELELEVEKLLFAKECELNAQADAKAASIAKSFQDELHATVKAQAEGFQATLQRELEAQSKKIHGELQEQLLHEVALLRKSHSDLLLALQPKIDELQKQLQVYDQVFDETQKAVDYTLRSHAISSSVLGLELLLSEQSAAGYGGRNIDQKFEQLESLCKDDELVVNLLQSLPARVRKEGALSVPELQVRFQVMRDEVRKAALAPEQAPKIVGQLVGSVLAAISIAPRGYVSGSGTEEILARAAYYVEHGKIHLALQELDKVSGYAKVLMNDWVSLAQERLVVDMTLRALKADSVVRHKSFQVSN